MQASFTPYSEIEWPWMEFVQWFERSFKQVDVQKQFSTVDSSSANMEKSSALDRETPLSGPGKFSRYSDTLPWILRHLKADT